MDWWLGYLAIGIFVGFFAGMLGIGGGGIIVPLLVMLFERQGLPREHILHLAVGTSMATIVFTSVSSVRAHAVRGALRWDIVRALVPGVMVGGLVGSTVAGFIPVKWFAAIFALVIYAAAVNILIERRPKGARPLPGWIGMSAAGFAISAVSAFAAIGGAFMTITFLVYCNVGLLQAIGTAAAVGFPIAVAGSIGFIAAGLSQAGLPQYSLGHVYLPALLGVTVASVLTAPLGAAAAHRMPAKWLRRTFAVLVFVLATKMAVGLW